MIYLAIDLGSSYIKSAVLNIEKSTISDIRLSDTPPRMEAPDGYFEVNACLIFEKTKRIIDEYLFRYDDIAGVLFSTQMHGFIITGNDRLPITNYISWQDRRCLQNAGPSTDGTYLDRLSSLIGREAMRECGVYLKPGMAMCNLFMMLQTGFHIDAGMNFCTLGSYVIFRLTGKNSCHITNAAPTGFANIVHNQWDEELIRICGCEGLAFPELTTTRSCCGIYSFHDRSIRIFPDIGDHQACLLGSMVRPDTDMNFNIGTAGLMGMVVRRFRYGPYEIRPFFDGYYVNTVTGLPGGRDLDVLIDFFQDVIHTFTGSHIERSRVWLRLHEILSGRQINDGLELQLRAFSGSGAITGISDKNLRVTSLLNAAYVQIADSYYTAFNKLVHDKGEIYKIRFSGGVALKNSVLVKVISRKLGYRCINHAYPYDSLIGLYRLALIYCGKCSSVGETMEYLEIRDGVQVMDSTFFAEK